MERLSSHHCGGITIYMGSRCNLGCQYCHRRASGDESGITDGFLAALGGYDRIRFMGGEPTLFFGDIRRVVEACPGAEFAIATNGKDLKKFLPFFREHDFHVAVSYDGAENGARGFDPFTERLRYPKLAVSCTLYHGNCDFGAILRKFAEKEKITGRPLSFYPHIVHVTDGGNARFALTDDDFDFIFGQYKECLTSFARDYGERGAVNTKYGGLVRRMLDAVKRNYVFGETRCVNGNLKKADAAGRFYPCLYVREPELSSGGWLEEQAAYIGGRFPACRGCSLYRMCGGACVKSADHDAECRFYRKLYPFFAEMYERHKNLFDRAEV